MKSSPARWFWTLAFITSFLTLALIVIGAIVRVTESGLGCGNDWPLCNGTIFPPLDNINAWIEWSHRLTAISIGLFGLAMLALALRYYRSHNRIVLGATVVAAILYAAQSDLGRNVVKEELSPTLVTFHLAMAMLLFASLLSAGVLARYTAQEHYSRDNVTFLIYINAVLALVVILIGGMVRGTGATLACVDWPLCNGQLFPFDQGQLAIIHMFHRFAVAAFGITLVLLVWYIWRHRSQRLVRTLAIAALIAYTTQAGIGALFVFSHAAGLWGALHVTVASLTWALLIALSIIETMNTRSVPAAALERAQTPA